MNFKEIEREEDNTPWVYEKEDDHELKKILEKHCTDKNTTLIRMKIKKYILYLVFTAAVLLCYLNTLKNPFIWDDEVTVVANPIIRSFKHIHVVFKTGLFGEKIEGGTYYRPLQILTYMADYKFWKLNPMGYHITNTALHLLNVFLLFLLLQRIGVNKETAFFSALIFAIHPVNTGGVTYISGRGGLLDATFSLLTFIFFLKGVSGYKRNYAFSIAFFILAFLSKENAIVTPFIMGVYTFMFLRKSHGKNRKQTNKHMGYLRPLAVLISLSTCYIIFRIILLIKGTNVTLSLIREAPLWQRLITFPRILLTYLRLLVAPFNLHMEYLFVVRSPASLYFWLGIPLLIVLAYIAIRFIKPKDQTIFFLFWFMLGLVPFYNIFIPLHATLLEHWLYLPAVGFYVIVSTAVLNYYLRIKTSLGRYMLGLLVVIYIGYYIYASVTRNQLWSNPLNLYSHDLKYEPNSFLLHNNIGVTYFRSGMMQKAKAAFISSIKVSPRAGYSVAYNNLGVIYENEGNIKSAIKEYDKSIQLDNYFLAYSNLARIYLNQAKVPEAVLVLEKGAALYPLDAEINYYLGIAYFYLKRDKDSAKVFSELDKLHPGYKDTHKFMRNIFKR